MLALIIYFLCAYVVFKGVEIFQIALCSPREDRARSLGLTVGIIAIIGAVAVAVLFGWIITAQQLELERQMKTLPRLNF